MEQKGGISATHLPQVSLRLRTHFVPTATSV